MSDFWEKVITPIIDTTNEPLYNDPASWPKEMGLSRPSITQRVAYDPETIEVLLSKMMEPQEINITYFEPVFLFSKAGMGGFVRGRIKTRGYLSEFKPAGMIEVSSGLDCKIEILDLLEVSK